MDQSIRDKTRGARSLESEHSAHVLPRLPRWPGRGRDIAGLGANRPADALPQGSSSQRTVSLNHRYRRLLGAADLMACLIAMAVCIVLLGDNDRLDAGLLAGLPLVLIISKVLGLYDRDELVLHKSTLEEAPKLFQLATLFSLVLWIASGPLTLGDLGGDQVGVMWGVLLLALLGLRVGARSIARRTSPPERCLLLGDPDACGRARAKIDQSGRVNAELVAEITSERIGEAEAPLATVAEMAVEQDIQRVIIAPRSTDHGDVLNLVRAVKSLGLNVSVLPRLLEIVGSSVVVDDVDGLRVLGVRRFGLTRSSLAVKRTLDVVCSGLGLVLLAPLLAVIAAAIKLDSRGPVLFGQPRIGRDDEVFGVLKFRSMVKITDDPRITRVGRFLRRSSLDELPHLINVVKGEMSLVGPRPLTVEDDAQIKGWDRHRLHLTPGITGPWQVLGSARIPLDEMVKLDYLYVATWSLWGDIKILLRTIAFVLGRQGL